MHKIQSQMQPLIQSHMLPPMQQVQQMQQMQPAQLQQWFSTGSGGLGVTQAYMAPMLPIDSRQLEFSSSCQQASMLGQQSPPGSACNGSPWSPQALLTTLMGDSGYAFNEQQIVDTLRAAAPEVYHD